MNDVTAVMNATTAPSRSDDALNAFSSASCTAARIANSDDTGIAAIAITIVNPAATRFPT